MKAEEWFHRLRASQISIVQTQFSQDYLAPAPAFSAALEKLFIPEHLIGPLIDRYHDLTMIFMGKEIHNGSDYGPVMQKFSWVLDIVIDGCRRLDTSDDFHLQLLIFMGRGPIDAVFLMQTLWSVRFPAHRHHYLLGHQLLHRLAEGRLSPGTLKKSGHLRTHSFSPGMQTIQGKTAAGPLADFFF